jgi:hypothetical protein
MLRSLGARPESGLTISRCVETNSGFARFRARSRRRNIQDSGLFIWASSRTSTNPSPVSRSGAPVSPGNVLRFASAVERSFIEQLSIVCDSEAPDLVCRRADGALVGVEHTRIIYQPEQDDDSDSDNFEILYDSAVALAKKEAKRRRAHWKLPMSTILVFDLLGRFRFEDWPADDSLSDDFSDTGFIEVAW